LIDYYPYESEYYKSKGIAYSFLNNHVESIKCYDKAIEEDYETEFYNLIEQIHANMNDFEIKDEQKISLIEYISTIIVNNETYKDKINNLNLFTDKLLNIN
jgi:tetratricopeptide (TPR) repeat protein